MTLSEGIIVAIIGLLGSLLVAVLAGQSARRKTGADAKAGADQLAIALCEQQRARIDQLHREIAANEDAIERVSEKQQARIDQLEKQLGCAEGRIAGLEKGGHVKDGIITEQGRRISALEKENAELKAQLESLQKRRVTK